MEHPDWYPDWRHDAFHELQDKNARLNADYRLGEWSRFDYDLASGKLIFSHEGSPRIIAEIQVAGTTSRSSGDWLWAWANDHWPPDSVVDSRLVRDFGEEHGICELMHDCVEAEDLNALGWELTSVMARVTNAVGAYRPPDDDGGLFLVIRSISWAG